MAFRKCVSTLEWQYASVCGQTVHVDAAMLCSACEEAKPKYYDRATAAFYCENDKPASAEEALFECSEGHALTRVRPDTKRPHFRHDKCDVMYYEMGPWHLDWQSQFTDCRVEYPFPMVEGQVKPRRADVFIEALNQSVEIQHSPPSDSLEARGRDHFLHCGKMPIWIGDGSGVAVAGALLDFGTQDNWRVSAFQFSDFVYYDVGGRIYKVNPGAIKNGQVDGGASKNAQCFVDAVKGGRDLWADEEEPSQFTIEVCQRGAGSGKTYGLMERLTGDFSEKYNTIIFLTKQHSAKEVMYAEFERQHGSGERLVVDSSVFLNKKYVVKCHLGDKAFTVVFATVDSLMCALAAKSEGFDKIRGWVDSVSENQVTLTASGAIRFAGEKPRVGPATLFVVDETQDLDEAYGKAFVNFVEQNNSHLCVVGDRLQSLVYAKSALTYMQEQGANQVTSENVVRRFSDPTLIDFVNEMVPFGDHALPRMTSSACASDAEPLKFLTLNDDTGTAVSLIMEKYAAEVAGGRRPEDFLIVSPYISNNPVMMDLWIAITDFWTAREATRKKYAVLHMSNEGSSIDLRQSNHATRMVSIHSSKGDGRPVVFLVGLDHRALLRYSIVPKSLVYDSLLHVALTRQKSRLYVCMTARKDTLTDKMSAFAVKSSLPIDRKPTYRPISMYVGSNKLFSHFYDKLNELKQPIMDVVPLPDFVDVDRPEIIDMGYHAIRFGSMAMNLYVACCNSFVGRPVFQADPLVAIFQKVALLPVTQVDTYAEYKAALRSNKNSKKQQIPLLKLVALDSGDLYQQHYETIRKTIAVVQRHIAAAGNRHMRDLGALECVVLHYMLEVVEKQEYANLNVYSLYEVIDLMANPDAESRLAAHFNELDLIGPMIRTFLTDKPAAKWSYHNPEWGTKKEMTLMCKDHYFAAEDGATQYMFYLKPTFSQISYHQTVFACLLDAVLMRLSVPNPVSVVVSFTHAGLYEIHWSNILTDADWDRLKPWAEESTVRHITSNFDLLHDKLCELHKAYLTANENDDPDAFCAITGFKNDHNPVNKERKHKVPPFVYAAIDSFFTAPLSKEVFVRKLTKRAEAVCRDMFNP